MNNLIRYNVVNKFVGDTEITWEFQADALGQWLEADTAVDRISELQAQLDGKWISVEKCPNKTDVLFCWPESGIMAVGRMEHRVMRQGGYKKDYFWGGHQFLEADDYPPTHWQPLPQPPKSAT
jgi:hypothetical protein